MWGSEIIAFLKSQGFDYLYFHTCDIPQTGYSGVAVFSKVAPTEVTKGFYHDAVDEEARVITLTFSSFHLLCTYVPCGGSFLPNGELRFEKKRAVFDQNIKETIDKLQQSAPVLWIGDHNIVQYPADVYDGAYNPNRWNWPSCTDGERSRFHDLLQSCKLFDVYEFQHPNYGGSSDHYTFFEYYKREKRQGYRIDLVLASEALKRNDSPAYIGLVDVQQDIAGSDHVPLSFTIATNAPLAEKGKIFDVPIYTVRSFASSTKAVRMQTVGPSSQVIGQTFVVPNVVGSSTLGQSASLVAASMSRTVSSESVSIKAPDFDEIPAAVQKGLRSNRGQNIGVPLVTALSSVRAMFDFNAAESTMDDSDDARVMMTELDMNKHGSPQSEYITTPVFSVNNGEDDLTDILLKWDVPMLEVLLRTPLTVTGSSGLNSQVTNDSDRLPNVGEAIRSSDAMLDTGATPSLISESLLRRRFGGNFHIQRSDVAPSFIMADKSRVSARGYVILEAYMCGKWWRILFWVLPAVPRDLIIGFSQMKNMRATLDLEEGVIRVDGKEQKFSTHQLHEDLPRVTSSAVFLTKDICLPPFGAQLIEARVDRRAYSSKGAFHIFVSDIGAPSHVVAKGPSILDKGVTRVLVQSTSSYPIYLRRGRKIAAISPFTSDDFVQVPYASAPLASSPNQEQSSQLDDMDPEVEFAVTIPMDMSDSRSSLTLRQDERKREEKEAELRSRVLQSLRRTLEDKQSELVSSLAVTSNRGDVNQAQLPEDLDLSGLYSDHWKREDILKFRSMLETHTNVFAEGKYPPAVVNYQVPRFEFDTDVLAPKVAGYRRVTPQQRSIIAKYVKELLDANIIKKSNSPWAAAIVMIPKKSQGEWRVAIDYRLLNKVLKSIHPNLPLISDTLDSLSGSAVFSTLDCAQSFFSLPLHEKDRETTAFSCPLGSFEFLRLPQGLKTSPAIFSRFMQMVLAGLQFEYVLTFIDDIIVMSPDLTAHIEQVDTVLTRLESYNIRLKPSKCFFARTQVLFLGHLVSADGVRPDPSKVSAISKMPHPVNISTLRSFLGLASYYRKFIPNFASKAAPLNALLRKGRRFPRKGFDPDQEAAFQSLKIALLCDPVLAFPDFNRPFILETDGSPTGLGCILTQEGVDGVERPIQYISRSLTASESNYEQYDRELLAVAWGLSVFHHYLVGQKFVIRTDNTALTYLKAKKRSSRHIKWAIAFQQYDYELQHRPGRKSRNVDALSRLPQPATDPYPTKSAMDVVSLVKMIDSYAQVSAPVVTRSQRTTEVVNPRKRTRSSLGNVRNSKRRKLTSTMSDEKESDPTNYSVIITDESNDRSVRRYYDLTCDTGELFKVHQRQDSELAQIVDVLEKKSPADSFKAYSKSYRLDEKGLLWYQPFKERSTVKTPSLNRDRVHQAGRLVVPAILKETILFHHHGVPLTGHLGSTKMIALIAARFYWKGMSKDIRLWCRSCVPCLRRKTPRPLRMGVAESMLVGRPFQRICIDFVGPFPESGAGNIWILTAVCPFTRWPIAVPLPDKRSITVARALYDHVIADHSCPEEILSDREPTLMSAVVKELCRLTGVKKIATSGLQPQANSHCERFHRFMNTALTLAVNRSDAEWEFVLKPVLFVFRISTNLSTGVSPFLAVYGRHPKLPWDMFSSSMDKDLTINDHYRTIKDRLFKIYESMRSSQEKMANRNRRRKQRLKLKTPVYSQGDPVFIWSPRSVDNRTAEGPCSKLSFKWTGPFIVKRRIEGRPNVVVVLKGPNDEVVVNVNRLFPYYPWEDGRPSLPDLRKDECREKPLVVISYENPDRQLSTGDLVVFPLNAEADAGNPFGVGKIISIQCDQIVIQWLSNFRENVLGTFRPGWIDTRNKHYYRHKPERGSHKRYTSVVSGTELSKDNIVLYGFSLTERDTLPPSVINAISKSRDIDWHLPDEE